MAASARTKRKAPAPEAARRPPSSSPADRLSPIPIYLQIEEELRSQIRSGALRPLARVDSESELAERFAVSRMTARKALDRLVGDGMLFRRPGKGTFVASPKIAHGPSTQLSFSAAMRSLGFEVNTRVLEAGIVRAPANVAQELNLAPDSTAVFIRRLRMVEGEPVAIHTSYLPPRYADVLTADLTGSLTELMNRAGARVIHSRETIEAVLAAGEEAELLRVPVGSPLVLIEGSAYSSTHEPLRHGSGLYKGGRFRFSVDTSRPAEIRVETRTAFGG